jgi:RNA polymerase-binding transcription factor DksA
MTDQFDEAQQLDAEFRALAENTTLAQIREAKARRQLEHPVSAEFCELADCGAPIPEGRREAEPGCRFCVVCQARIEKNPVLRRRYE